MNNELIAIMLVKSSLALPHFDTGSRQYPILEQRYSTYSNKKLYSRTNSTIGRLYAHWKKYLGHIDSISESNLKTSHIDSVFIGWLTLKGDLPKLTHFSWQWLSFQEMTQFVKIWLNFFKKWLNFFKKWLNFFKKWLNFFKKWFIFFF